MGEEEKLNWVNVINFLEVLDKLCRRSIRKAVSGRRSGSMRGRCFRGGYKVWRQKYDQMLMCARGWLIGLKYFK